MLTSREIAAILHVHPKQIYRLLKRGMPAHKVGDEWRFIEREVLEWTSRHSSDPPVTSSTAAEQPSMAVGPKAGPPLLAANGDVAIEIALALVRRTREQPIGFVQDDHDGGIALLERGAVLAAGCHGDDPPKVRDGCARLHLAVRSVGLVSRKAKLVRDVRGITGLRVASRPPTAGVRRILAQSLARAGMSDRTVHKSATLHASHRDVVCAIARGEADVGVATQAWAHRLGLAFTPLGDEPYGIVLRASCLGDPTAIALCEVVQTKEFRKSLEAQPGYQTTRTGELRHLSAQ